MSRIADPPIIRAAARVLQSDPDLPTVEAMRRLVETVGPELADRIRINRFERQVREPALRLLRTNGGIPKRNGAPKSNGVEGRTHLSPSRGTDGQKDARFPEPGPANGAGPNVVRAVDDALLEAFELGAGADSPSDVVRAFCMLDELRGKMRRRLDRSG